MEKQELAKELFMIILSAAKASNSGAGSSMLFMIILLIAMIGLMVWTSRKQKKQQSQVQDFRQTLKEGDPVATVGGLLGTVHSVDLEHDEVVIDSEGSLSKWRIQAITEPPIRPAYVSDDEVDENGNPLADQSETADSSDSSETVTPENVAPSEQTGAATSAAPAASFDPAGLAGSGAEQVPYERPAQEN